MPKLTIELQDENIAFLFASDKKYKVVYDESQTLPKFLGPILVDANSGGGDSKADDRLRSGSAVTFFGIKNSVTMKQLVYSFEKCDDTV